MTPPQPQSPLARIGVSRPDLVALLLAAVWLLNLADLLLTRRALWLGFASESNRVMGYFLRRGSLTAAVFKIGIVTSGVVLLWRLRSRRSVVFAAAFLAAVLAAVVTYQVLWLLSL